MLRVELIQTDDWMATIVSMSKPIPVKTHAAGRGVVEVRISTQGEEVRTFAQFQATQLKNLEESFEDCQSREKAQFEQNKIKKESSERAHIFRIPHPPAKTLELLLSYVPYVKKYGIRLGVLEMYDGCGVVT